MFEDETVYEAVNETGYDGDCTIDPDFGRRPV